jgi:succinate dehydrogenase / fumarate reductase, membrane anchor subunit
MASSSSNLTTKLGRVRGLGAAGHGVSHWWLQRVTAVAMIPLSLWLMSSLVSVIKTPDVVVVAQWISSPLNALLLVLFLVAVFVHAKLGAQVVIEDYIKHPVVKYALLMANTFVCFLFAGICILSILKLHLLDAGAPL